ncbi:hypothetical protein LTR22_024501 [Elasticomyces elasticus]|nr:hypothetical protein LTR22_024501 [Elasticomyces elasticus]KAK4905742.1 hypothetical protein LTR49_024991 [Elasticomyces elasticus]KAK5743216.1 hypothetical protein LTS12_023945 [Elasticomyces elasticus]
MASPQTQSSLDKIPAELRIEIFGLALHHEDALLLVHHDGRTRDECKGDNEPLADIALLVALVNDPKYHEAFEAFYDVNSFLATRNIFAPITGPELQDSTQGPLAWITHLQLVNLVNYQQFLSPKRLEHTLEMCAQMPKLKSLTIAYDSLYDVLTPRKWLSKVVKLSAHELVCMGVGHFRLRYKDKLSVDFKQYTLMQCWQKVKLATPMSFADLVAALELELAGKHPSVDCDYGGDCIDTTITFIDGLRFTDWLTLLDEQTKLDITALRAKLKDLDEGEKGSNLVEAFSEFLQSGVRDKSPQMGDARYQRTVSAHLGGAPRSYFRDYARQELKRAGLQEEYKSLPNLWICGD